MRLSIPETLTIVDLLVPKSDAAGREVTIWPSLKNAIKAWIVCYINQGDVAQIDCIPLQTTNVANAGNVDKVLSHDTLISSNLDMAAASAFAKETPHTHYLTDAGVKHKCIVFEIDPNQCMDVNNPTPFDCIGMSFGASHANNITSAFLVIQPKYGGCPQPDYITD